VVLWRRTNGVAIGMRGSPLGTGERCAALTGGGFAVLTGAGGGMAPFTGASRPAESRKPPPLYLPGGGLG